MARSRTVQPTREGPAPVATLDPYKRVEAETIAWSSGVKIEPAVGAGGQNVRDIHDGDYIQVRNVAFPARPRRRRPLRRKLKFAWARSTAS
jgi:hypothetical protein